MGRSRQRAPRRVAERLSWEAAEARCVAWGGHLASVESSEEDAFLDAWPALLGIPEGDGSGIWLGGTDARLEGDLRWPNGQALSIVGWAPNQPDNGAGVDCIEKRNDGAGHWYDLRCTHAEPYVCERPLWRVEEARAPQRSGAAVNGRPNRRRVNARVVGHLPAE